VTALERREQVRLHHDAAARAVDQRAPGRSNAARAPRHALGLRREGTWKVTTSASRSSVSKSGQARAEVARARLGNVGIEDEQPRRVEAAQARGHARADLAEADDAERLAVQLGA